MSEVLAAMVLYELTAEDLENLYERKLDEGAGVSTVRYVHTTTGPPCRTPSRSA